MEFTTTGKVKFARYDGLHYIIPDKTLDGYCGINILYQTDSQEFKRGDLVKLKVQTLLGKLIATDCKKIK